MSFLLNCPICGTREVTDFGFGGEIVVRPESRPGERELNRYNYFRANTAGVQREWWWHRAGCRTWFQAERNTLTNEVLWTAVAEVTDATQAPAAPVAEARAAGGEELR